VGKERYKKMQKRWKKKSTLKSKGQAITDGRQTCQKNLNCFVLITRVLRDRARGYSWLLSRRRNSIPITYRENAVAVSDVVDVRGIRIERLSNAKYHYAHIAIERSSLMTGVFEWSDFRGIADHYMRYITCRYLST